MPARVGLAAAPDAFRRLEGRGNSRAAQAVHGGNTLRFQILALSGGGYLGLYTAKILAELERRTARPIGECFDLVCGTSIGGILALGIGRGVAVADMVAAFEQQGEAIFSGRPKPRTRLGGFWDLRRSVLGPKYNGVALRRTVTTLLEDKPLSASRHRLLIPAVNISQGAPRMFKTGHARQWRIDHSIAMADIAMATSAAPTFFPPVEIEGDLFTDGGLYANAPDMCGLHEATCFLGQQAEDVHVLSIGTTTTSFGRPHDNIGRMGAARWLADARLLTTMIGSQQQITDSMMRHRLGDRYVRLDDAQSDQDAPVLALDVATKPARGVIDRMSRRTLLSAAENRAIDAMLAHRPEPPHFYNTPR
jgi:uncharacterized protein